MLTLATRESEAAAAETHESIFSFVGRPGSSHAKAASLLRRPGFHFEPLPPPSLSIKAKAKKIWSSVVLERTLQSPVVILGV